MATSTSESDAERAGALPPRGIRARPDPRRAGTPLRRPSPGARPSDVLVRMAEAAHTAAANDAAPRGADGDAGEPAASEHAMPTVAGERPAAGEAAPPAAPDPDASPPDVKPKPRHRSGNGDGPPSFLAARHLGVETAQRAPRKQPMNGHVRLIAAPDYGQLLAREPILRRAIPLLTAIFILVIAAYQVAIGLDHRAAAERQAKAELTLVATALSAEMSRRAAEDPRTRLADVFATSLPDDATQNGRLLALLENDAVTATSPVRSDLVGVPSSRLLGANQPMTTFGKRAGVMDVETQAGIDFATVHILEDGEGMVAVVQPREAVLAGWREEVSTSAVLFTTTAGVIILVVYAFYAQSARARSADHIYQSTQGRIDTALLRGRCGLFDWDLAGGRMYWTQSMFEVLGMAPRDDLMGFREVAALVHPDDGGLYEMAERQLVTNDKVLDKTLRMRHADGRWVWLRMRAELVHDHESGRPHLIGVALDTTEQKRLAELSATADMRLRDAIETVSEAFVLWDSSNRLVMCNTKYQEMHSLPDDAVRPGTAYNRVIDSARQPVVSSQLLSSSDGPDEEHSYEAELQGGRWLQINERRTKDGGFVSVGTDITALKTHEERLMESEKRLKANVSELKNARRTAENQTRQLAELAEKYAEEKTRAEDANRAKSEFLANISHELRTPLNAIIGFSEIMKGKMFGALGSPKYEEYSGDIHHSGTYLLGVINDILDMSRIEAGQVDLSVETVDLTELFNEATRIMTPIAAEKTITLASAIGEGMQVEVDRRAMKQILLNLMSNAVKFTPNDGCVTTRARLEREWVVVAVEDNGIGIPRRELDRLGQPFVQVENQFTKTHQGSGLGLAIARSLTELHRGKMVIESEVGVGTTVTVRLPRGGV